MSTSSTQGRSQVRIGLGATTRPVEVVDAGQRKVLDLRVAVPVEDSTQLGQPLEVSGGLAANETRASF